ncbi:SRPBCC family protein [Halobacillus locisalis]|uniref:SRPBCC family protein n=1 Tax=Halobacillus locisalis TaxID=220753 RepID=A0A838CTG4_9BACI|nr:SRPBCC family protein [Halobacillus locisalis]MBA2175055.1 SRPBCC family protein [Halobacillus locisalis]
MSFLEKSIMIKKPIEDVFQAATDFSNSPEIMDAVVGVELLTEGPVREGYEFKETREIRGRKVSSKIVVTDFEKDKSYSVRSVQQGLDLRYHYTFTQTTEGTRVDFKGDLFTEGLRNKLAQPLIKKIIKKEDQDHLKHLKNYIESMN